MEIMEIIEKLERLLMVRETDAFSVYFYFYSSNGTFRGRKIFHPLKAEQVLTIAKWVNFHGSLFGVHQISIFERNENWVADINIPISGPSYIESLGR